MQHHPGNPSVQRVWRPFLRIKPISHIDVDFAKYTTILVVHKIMYRAYAREERVCAFSRLMIVGWEQNIFQR